MNSIAKTNIQDNVDSMTVRLMQAEEELQKERERVERLEKEVRKEVFILKVHFTWQ